MTAEGELLSPVVDADGYGVNFRNVADCDSLWVVMELLRLTNVSVAVVVASVVGSSSPLSSVVEMNA